MKTNFQFISALIVILTITSGSAYAEAGKTLKPGDIFRDCTICPEMTVIPAGSFKMGSTKGKKRELPVTQITISKPLAVSRYEITFDEWDACHAEGGCKKSRLTVIGVGANAR